MKSELSPLEDRGVTILATVNAPDGSTLEYTNRYAQALERMGQPTRSSTASSPTGNPRWRRWCVVFPRHPGKTASAPRWNWRASQPSSMPARRQRLHHHAANARWGRAFRERPVNFVIHDLGQLRNLAA